VLRLAGATLDAQLVEHRFETLADELDHALGDFARRVDETAEALLDDETGTLKGALAGWLDEVTSTLESTFDEESRTSAIAKLEALLARARTEQVKAVRGLLDPDNDESPLAGWRREIVAAVERQGKAVEAAIADLRERIAVDRAAAEAQRKTAIKGFTFEQQLLEVLGPLVTPLGDVPAHVGNDTGSCGTKVGDVVVTIDPEETPGRDLRYVLEAKDRKLSLAKALAELDDAIANRDAAAGIIVFAGDDLSPVEEPFACFDHKAVVVLDRDTLDPHALRLACLWARWVCLRDERPQVDAIDAERVGSLLEAARTALCGAKTIRGSHTQARKAIEQAGATLDQMTAAVTTALDELEHELDR
jgi:hypothetical protein